MINYDDNDDEEDDDDSNKITLMIMIMMVIMMTMTITFWSMFFQQVVQDIRPAPLFTRLHHFSQCTQKNETVVMAFA